MIIQPISRIATLNDLSKLNKINPVDSAQIPFKSMFVDALSNAKTSQLELDTEIQKVATGQTDDLHNVNIASTKAALSLEMVVQLRNKALEAYNSIMQMGV